jgi:hypothetical protein
MWWNGWQLLNYSIFLFSGVLVLTFIKRDQILAWEKENKRIFIKNILVPLVYSLVMGGAALMLSHKTFYETFNSHRSFETYEQFLGR